MTNTEIKIRLEKMLVRNEQRKANKLIPADILDIKDIIKQLSICDVVSSKRKSNIELFNKMNNDFMQAIIDSDNGIYDPIEEFGKELENKYIIIEK